MSRKYC